MSEIGKANVVCVVYDVEKRESFDRVGSYVTSPPVAVVHSCSLPPPLSLHFLPRTPILSPLSFAPGSSYVSHPPRFIVLRPSVARGLVATGASNRADKPLLRGMGRAALALRLARYWLPLIRKATNSDGE